MPVPLQPELDALAPVLADPERLVRAIGAGRRRGLTPAWRRVELRPVDLKAGRVLQVVTYDERQAHTANHAEGAPASAAVAALLAEPFGNWHVETLDQTIELRVTKKGEAQVHRAGPPVAGAAAGGRSHDRAKSRLLDASHPVFRALGIADAHGRIKPSRQDKYRQVEDFLRQLAVMLPDAGEGALRVVDLGCGNAYLTFAAYAYLTDVGGRDVRMTGVDVREQARAHNETIATELGWGDRLTFVAAPIDSYVPDERPDVVLALHACDTATDDALVQAVRWQAPVVLAAPCCHHELQRRIKAAGAPSPYGLVTRHGLLGERLADVLTDALRAAVLRMLGYRVDVVEFVDSAHTPRNALLRAVRTGAAASPETVDEYRALTQAWGITPYLADALADDLRPVLAGA